MATQVRPSPAIHKIGAIILASRRLLVVRKRAYPETFIIPGGRLEPAETHYTCLSRELREELCLVVSGVQFFNTYHDVAHFEHVPLRMDVYVVQIAGQPRPANEIAAYRWISRNYARKGITLGTALARHVVPALVQQGLM